MIGILSLITFAPLIGIAGILALLLLGVAAILSYALWAWNA